MDPNSKLDANARLLCEQIKLDERVRLELQIEHGGTLSVEYREKESGEDGENGEDADSARYVERLRSEVLAKLENLALKGELELFVVSCLCEDRVRWQKLRGKEQHERVPHLFEIYNGQGVKGLERLLQQVAQFPYLGRAFPAC